MNEPTEGEPLDRSSDSAGGELKSPRLIGDLQKTITMAQIAKAAGVSQGAISSLLNDRDYGIRVSEKTRERVFRVCREMGYIPNDLRALVRMYPEFGEYCLLVSSRRVDGLADPVVARIAGAAMAATSDDARSVTVGCYDEKEDYSGDPEKLPHPVRTGVASKFILFGAPNGTLIHALSRRGWRIVSLGYDAQQSGVLSLVPDYQIASRTAVEHLLALGHRHIGIVSGPFGATEPQIIELNRGVRIAYENAGIPLDPQNIIYGDLTFEAGVAAFDTLIEHTPVPTAVFCMSDAVAAGMIAEAQSRGRHVPEQLSVVGCGDDTPARYTWPPLTTVHIPTQEMAAQAIRDLDRMVHESAQGEPKRVVFDVKLVERKSTAAPAKS